MTDLVYDNRIEFPEEYMELIREDWDSTAYNELIGYMQGLANNNLKEKTQKLIPDTPNMLGIPMAALKEIGLKIAKGNGKDFLNVPKSDCYEETIIEAYVIGNIKLQYSEFLSYIKHYSEKANSWVIPYPIPANSIGCKGFLQKNTQDVAA